MNQNTRIRKINLALNTFFSYNQYIVKKAITS